MDLLTAQRALEERTIRWADDLRSWGLAWETGIYPGEMAAFLGLCDVSGARSIIESGRGLHAYSTQVLGEYAERTGARVLSIDLESDPIRGAKCRHQLSRYSQVECVVGDAFRAFPRVAAQLPGPVALLLDGPKEFAANRLSLLASVLFPVVAVAHHNSDPGLPWSAQFARFFPGAYHYEDLDLRSSPVWHAFKEWEREAVGGYELAGTPGRSLSSSSLILSRIVGAPRTVATLMGIPGLRGRASMLTMLIRWQVATAQVMSGGS